MSRRGIAAPAKRTGLAELAGSAALGAWAAFAVLAMVVAGGHGAPLFTDQALLDWSVHHRPAMAVAVARGLTDTGTGVVPYVLAALAGALVGRTARQRAVACLLAVACLATGQAVRYGVMELVGRARPPRYEWQAQASGWSFPSGHTTTAALTAGLLILAICLRAPHARVLLCLAVGCWGAGVGLTRVFLGVHWFTDVLGGWLFAVGWLGALLCVAAWRLPARWFTPAGSREPDPLPAADSADAPSESRAPQDPDRRGRSRSA